MPTKCPQCEYPQYCGCWGCRDVIPEGFSPQIITDEGYKCTNCGFEASFEEWELLDYNLLDYNQILSERQLNGYLKKEEEKMSWKVTIWVSSSGIPRIGIRGIKDWKDECDDYDMIYGSQIRHRCVVYDDKENRYRITTHREAKKLGLPFRKF